MFYNASTLKQLNRASGIMASRLHEDWNLSKRVADNYLVSRHPTALIRDYIKAHFDDMADAVDYLRKQAELAQGQTLLIRSLSDTTPTPAGHEALPLSIESSQGWHALRYLQAVQHFLVLDALQPSGANIMVVIDRHWPGGDDELTMTIPRDEPLFAVMHRSPDDFFIELRAPLGDGESAEEDYGHPEMSTVEKLHPDWEIGPDDLGGTGLISQSAGTRLLEDNGFTSIEGWTLGGKGHPVGFAAVLRNSLKK